MLSSLISTTTSTVQAGVLRGAAWAARGLRVPARNALLADVVPATAYGRAYAAAASKMTTWRPVRSSPSWRR